MKYLVYKIGNTSFFIKKQNAFVSIINNLTTSLGIIASIILCFKYLPDFWIVQIFLCIIFIMLIVGLSKKEKISREQFIEELKNMDLLNLDK